MGYSVYGHYYLSWADLLALAFTPLAFSQPFGLETALAPAGHTNRVYFLAGGRGLLVGAKGRGYNTVKKV